MTTVSNLLVGIVAWGPILERPGNFSGPKSHFKTHEAPSTGFTLKDSLHFRFESKNLFFVFQRRSFKVDFPGTKLFRGFRGTGPRSGWFSENTGLVLFLEVAKLAKKKLHKYFHDTGLIILE